MTPKRPFLIFVAVMALLIGGVISYIQSPAFASFAKRALYSYMPKDLGIEGDFSEFKVKLFPPGVSIVKPRIRLLEHNVLELPPGSSVSAERIDLAFRPVQMFSSNIRVHEVTIVGGDVNLVLADALAPKRKRRPGSPSSIGTNFSRFMPKRFRLQTPAFMWSLPALS